MTPDKISELTSRPGGYRLSDGVSATWEGLIVKTDGGMNTVANAFIEFRASQLGPGNGRRIPWADAAERLHYRDGEPWCYAFDRNIVCGRPGVPELAVQIKYTLHRLAAILCDDANAFRMLHWCIHNLGGTECTHS